MVGRGGTAAMATTRTEAAEHSLADDPLRASKKMGNEKETGRKISSFLWANGVANDEYSVEE